MALEVHGLTKQYDNIAAVKSASFSVPRGTICGFVGPNGAGKTTSIRMLLGLITPTAGTGMVLGHPIAHPEKYLASVGAMIEGPAFYPALTGSENLKVLATMGGIPIERVDQLIDLVGLSVVNRENVCLGSVEEVMDHGAHPILVVQPPEALPSDVSDNSTAPQSDLTDGKPKTLVQAEEILIPFVPVYIDAVSLADKKITVDWQADY